MTLIMTQSNLLPVWVESLAITEIPQSFQLLAGISVIGALLRRNVWVDQVEWRVYPNVSVMFVGPTGIGKDVVIRRAVDVISELDEEMIVGGKTIEAIQQALLDRTMPGQPTAAVIPLPELTAFLGGKDYQKSAVQELTDLLSTGERLTLNLRSVKGDRTIHQPTVTVLAGSTVEWLHRAMPEGALEGGFVPRFLVVSEEYTGRHVPWLKYSIDVKTRRQAVDARKRFMDGLHKLAERYRKPRELTPLPEAVQAYESWYIRRFKTYPPTIRGYINRSRDHVLRIAMVSACARLHDHIDADDIAFAVGVIGRVAASVESISSPVNEEAVLADAILAFLPATFPAVIEHFSRHYSRRNIDTAVKLLLESNRAYMQRSTLRPKASADSGASVEFPPAECPSTHPPAGRS